MYRLRRDSQFGCLFFLMDNRLVDHALIIVLRMQHAACSIWQLGW